VRPFASALTGSVDAGGGLLLRPLAAGDLGAIAAMLADPEIARWYDSDVGEIESLLGHPFVTPFLAVLDGAPAGYLQAYHANRDDFWPDFGVPAETFGLDMFLARRGEGLGVRLARAMAAHLFGMERVVRVQIDPDPDNRRAVRAYEKAGFVPRGIMPGYDGATMHYMTIDR